MPEEERKKAIKKERKAGAKLAGADGTATTPTPKDKYGVSFVAGVDHLQEAMKFLSPLISHRQDDINTWLLACKVYSARGI